MIIFTSHTQRRRAQSSLGSQLMEERISKKDLWLFEGIRSLQRVQDRLIVHSSHLLPLLQEPTQTQVEHRKIPGQELFFFFFFLKSRSDDLTRYEELKAVDDSSYKVQTHTGFPLEQQTGQTHIVLHFEVITEQQSRQQRTSVVIVKCFRRHL